MLNCRAGLIFTLFDQSSAATGFQHSRAPFVSELAAGYGFRLNHSVAHPLKPRRSGPPHNPNLRDLVDGKRRWSSSSTRADVEHGFRGWHERGYLPHRDEPGLIQFVTFRLTDSFPESLRSEWEHIWKIENDLQRRAELEAYLDRGRGHCHLRRPEIAKIVEDAMQFFHGERYELRAWVVMPNYVHALFKVSTTPMAKIMESWKKHTAQKANRIFKRRGNFWQVDYWDTFMRDAQHEKKTMRYIENNPTKAKLALDPKNWPWSSARLRDNNGTLRLERVRAATE